MDNSPERIPSNNSLAQCDNDVGIEDDVDIENDDDGDDDNEVGNDNDGGDENEVGNDNDGDYENEVGNGNDHTAEIGAVSRKLLWISFRYFIMHDFHYDCHSRRRSRFCCLISPTIILYFSCLQMIVYHF